MPQPLCTIDDIQSYGQTLKKFDVEYASLRELTYRRTALQLLTQFKRKLAAAIQQQAPASMDRAKLEALGTKADRVGALIALLEDRGLTPLIQCDGESPITAEKLRDLERLFRMSCCLDPMGEQALQQMTKDLRAKERGFDPIETPWVPDVMETLQQGTPGTSRVYALNAGGTEVQASEGLVTTKGTDALNFRSRKIEKRICASWDDFWSLHFTEEDLACLRQADPNEITIAMGLAFPLRTFRTSDKRTDANIGHFADKYDAIALGPKNAAEMAHWQPQGPDVSFATSLRAFLHRATGKHFPRITIAPNDTLTAQVAFCTSESARGKVIGALVDGTGFNICTRGTNLEAGHYRGSLCHTIFESIAMAQRGGGAVDLECSICGKILNETFLNILLASSNERLIAGFDSIPYRKRNIMIHRLVYGGDLSEFGLESPELQTLQCIARPFLERAETRLAHALAAVHEVYGTDAIYGEGSIIRNETQFRDNVNNRVRKLLPGFQGDIVLVEPLPLTFRDPSLVKYGTASLAGTFMYAHGENLFE